MNTKALLIGIILFATPLTAKATDWTLSDTMLQGTFLVLMNIDRSQTANYAGQREEIGLARSFIGEYPTSGEVNRYFAATAALHTAMAYVLPKSVIIPWIDVNVPARQLWQSFWITVEGDTIHKNTQVGVSISF